MASRSAASVASTTFQASESIVVQDLDYDGRVLKVTTALKDCKKVALVPRFVVNVSNAHAKVYTTGGLPPLVSNPDVVYSKTFGKYINLGNLVVD